MLLSEAKPTKVLSEATELVDFTAYAKNALTALRDEKIESELKDTKSEFELSYNREEFVADGVDQCLSEDFSVYSPIFNYGKTITKEFLKENGTKLDIILLLCFVNHDTSEQFIAKYYEYMEKHSEPFG